MAKMQIAPVDRPKVKLECLRIITTLKLNPARSALIGDFIGAYLNLTGNEEVVYNQQVTSLDSSERTKVMLIMNEWVERAVHAKAKVVATRLLQHRFGPISAELRSRVDQLSLDALDEMVTAALDFKSLAEADEWISHHLQDLTA